MRVLGRTMPKRRGLDALFSGFLKTHPQNALCTYAGDMHTTFLKISFEAKEGTNRTNARGKKQLNHGLVIRKNEFITKRLCI